MENKDLFEKVKKALFEDWRATKLKEDGTYDEKLYKVTSDEFIKRCKKEKLCKYEELENGDFKAAIATLDYDKQPKYNEERKEDILLFELCLKGIDDEDIAKQLNDLWCKEHSQNIKFEELSETDKNYYYNEISICKKVIEKENNKN